jgi:hypothetical protein
VAAEDEQVEVQLARPPSLALTPPERALQPLQRDEETQRAGRRIGAARDVDRGDRVMEVRLVDHTDGRGDVEPRDAAERGTRQRGKAADPGGDRLCRVADVRPEPDVRSNSPGQCPAS